MQDRILNEAISLIQQKGFTFTISELATKLGTSKRTIYDHFSSKDQMIEMIIDNLISQIKEKEKEIAENDDLELLEKINQILCCTPKDFEIMDMRLLSDLKKHHYHQWEKLDYFIKKEWSIVLQLMEQGIEQGLIRPINLQAFIELYLGAINQIYDPISSNQRQQTFGERLQTVMDILLNGITIRS
ncbi:TetR family transcriptional regulator [Bacillus sp. SA1-12]|uniref:TetR/AcrR family transcriptional regulator n=1 Tax=Bacillus sp. SA1-12 TaxID=1455638 RepID=UPI0006264549|nr:TetR/AcrR family transcriptional regulator [Bacillus sp. SA1-12]KKI92500.1 TetR family transcriptional regulator [Bacillus sp. SA1-12]